MSRFLLIIFEHCIFVCTQIIVIGCVSCGRRVRNKNRTWSSTKSAIIFISLPPERFSNAKNYSSGTARFTRTNEVYSCCPRVSELLSVRAVVERCPSSGLYLWNLPPGGKRKYESNVLENLNLLFDPECLCNVTVIRFHFFFSSIKM